MREEMRSPEFRGDRDKRKCLEFLTEFTEDVLARNERQEKIAARMTQDVGNVNLPGFGGPMKSSLSQKK